MASDNMKRVGLVFTADGAVDFKKTLSDVNNAVKENYSSFKLAQSQWNENTKSLDKLADRQKYLQGQTELYSDKVEVLTRELKEMESAETRDESAISKKQTQLNQAKAKLNEYEKGLEEVNKELQKGTANLQDYADKLEKAGEKMTSAGKTMTKGVTTPIVGVATAAVKTAADFESSMSQVQATMGITKDATSELNGKTVNTMDAMKALAKEMGEKTAFSAKECGDAINFLALAGYDTQQTYDTLPTVLNLAAAGNMDLAQASDMVTDAMSALGMGTDQAETMVDQMAKTASSTNTSVAQLGEGILTIGATAKSVKGGTAELNTALGILANNSIKGAEGGTHLRNVILSLQSPTDTAAAELEKLGVKVYDSDGKMRSMNDILGELNESMEGMSNKEKDGIISKIFNKTDLASVNALLANTGDTWNDLQNKINNSKGTGQDMADTQLDNLQGQLTLLKSAIEGLAISFGETLLPTIKKIVEHVQGVVDKLNKMDEGQRQTIVTISLVVAAIGPMLIILGTLAGSVSKIITFSNTVVGICVKIPGVLSTIGTGAKTLWVIISANPFGAFIVLVTAVVAVLVTMYNKCEWFRDGVNSIFKSIGEWIEGLVEKFQKLISFLGKIGKKVGKAFSEPANLTASVSGTKVPVKWNAKGGIFNKPTLIGQYGGKMQGVGEAGEEAVLPIDQLRLYIREENQSNNETLAALIATAIAEALQGMSFVSESDICIGGKKVEKVLYNMVLKKLSGSVQAKRGAVGA